MNLLEESAGKAEVSFWPSHRHHYLKRGSEKPAYYRIEPPPGVLQWNGIDDAREVWIEDARGRESDFTLDLVKAATASPIFTIPRRSSVSTILRSSGCRGMR